jgi:hypothetical protein
MRLWTQIPSATLLSGRCNRLRKFCSMDRAPHEHVFASILLSEIAQHLPKISELSEPVHETVRFSELSEFCETISFRYLFKGLKVFFGAVLFCIQIWIYFKKRKKLCTCSQLGGRVTFLKKIWGEKSTIA